MRSSAGRGTDGRLPRAARRLGFDRNPLRRGTDRVEAIQWLIPVILLVAAVPATAVAAGRQADHVARRRGPGPAIGESPGSRRPAS